MPRTLKKSLLMLSFCCLLSACNRDGGPTNDHQISLQQTVNFGFTNAEIVDLGRLVMIDYFQFDSGRTNANPSFPVISDFPSDSELLHRYRALANIQGRDKVGAGQEELYGHIWRDQNTRGLIISIRGTSDRQEWIDDAKFQLIKLEPDLASTTAKEAKNAVEVELGFHEIESSLTISSQAGTVKRTPLANYINTHSNLKSLTIVGHSMGSSLATLFAYKTKLRRPELDIRLLTFASPLTGAPNFSASFESQLEKSIRIVNRPDIVPKMPFAELGYKHVWRPVFIDSSDSKRIVDSIACHHSLNTYLHMLDETVKPTKACSKSN